MTQEPIAPHATNETWPRHVRLALLALGAVLLLNVALLFLDYLATYAPRAPLLENIRHAYATEELTDKDHLMLDARRGYNQFNDCMILEMAISHPADRLHDAVSPSYFVFNDNGAARRGENSICGTLREAAFYPDAGTLDVLYYHRYIIGQRTLMRLVMPYVDLATLHVVFKGTCYALLAVMFAVGARRYMAARKETATPSRLFDSRAQPLLLIVASLYFAVFYGLEYYGQSLNHAPSEILLFAFMIAAVSFNWLGGSLRRFYLTAALFGCLTVYYEFLSGPIPLGAGVLLALIGLQTYSSDEPRVLWSRLLGGGLIYILAIALSFAFNITSAAMTFGWEVFGDMINRMQMRTGSEVIIGNALLDKEYLSEIVAATPLHRVTIGWLDELQALRWSLHQITWGNHYLGYALMFSALLMYGYALYSLLRARPVGLDRARIVALLLSAMAVPAWYVLFKNHTYINSYFMIRPVVWVPIMACLFLMLVLSGGARRQSRTR